MLISRTRSTLQSSLLAKSHLNGLFFLIQSNLSLRTPLLYGQFVWYQKSQKSYIPYLYNTDSSVKWTLGSVPLVSVLKRFYCIEVFKGPRLSTHKILDLQTRFKPIETFQCTHALLILPLSSRLSRTNSVHKENFEQSKGDFAHRLCQRGYPLTLVKEIQTEVKFTNRKEALRNKTKQTKEILPFVTTYNPATPNLKNIFMAHHLTAT